MRTARHTPHVRTLAVGLALAALASVAVAQRSVYTVTDLGSLSGNTGSAAALALSDDGGVVGWSTAPVTSAAAISARRPFLWTKVAVTPNGQMRDLLIGLPGSGEAAGRNNFGACVGTFTHTNLNEPRGFMVNPATLGPLPGAVFISPLPGGNATSAADVNDQLLVVGSSNLLSNTAVVRPTHAIAWQNGQTIDLGTLGGRNSQATAVNNAGSIVGVSDTPLASNTRPYRRGFIVPGLGHPMQALSSLTNTGSSRANDISDTQIIVGASDWASPVITPTSAIPTRAVMWTPASVSIVNLGTLRNTDHSSEALGVNDAGQIVGWSGTPSNTGPISTGPSNNSAFAPTRAFLWENGQMKDLNTMIPAASGWVLLVATDINENGEIVGWGRRVSPTVAGVGPIRAFLLTPAR